MWNNSRKIKNFLFQRNQRTVKTPLSNNSFPGVGALKINNNGKCRKSEREKSVGDESARQMLFTAVHIKLKKNHQQTFTRPELFFSEFLDEVKEL